MIKVQIDEAGKGVRFMAASKKCPVKVRRSGKNREHVKDFKVLVNWGDTAVFTADGTAATVIIPNAVKIFGASAAPNTDCLVAKIASGDTWETPIVKDSAGGTKDKREAYPYAVYCGGQDGFAEKQGNTSPILLIGPP